MHLSGVIARNLHQECRPVSAAGYDFFLHTGAGAVETHDGSVFGHVFFPVWEGAALTGFYFVDDAGIVFQKCAGFSFCHRMNISIGCKNKITENEIFPGHIKKL